jgi:uncharacterized protein YjbI with pentapeptide repeats
LSLKLEKASYVYKQGKHMGESIVTSKFRELICSPSDWDGYKNTLSKADRVIDDIILDNVPFTYQDYSQMEFTDCVFVDCLFCNVNFKGSYFRDVDFIDCCFEWADFSKAILDNPIFKNCCFEWADFSKAILDNPIFKNCSFIQTEFSHSEFYSLDLTQSSWRWTSLSKAKLIDCKLPGNFFKMDVKSLKNNPFLDETKFTNCWIGGITLTATSNLPTNSTILSID